ncbi:FCD domain-containing protein [Brucellaceae bacterium D45D]
MADRILDLAAVGDLQPGDHMRAQQLADRFQVSRYPMTEAFQLLSHHDFAEHRPHYGFYLTDLATITRHRFAPDTTNEEALYQMIANDHLERRLPELVTGAFLSERYALSRSQISALMTRITAEGWASRRSGQGWHFNDVLRTPEAVAQTYRVRLAIEPAAILEPTFHLPAERLEQLKSSEKNLLDGGIETLSPEELYQVGVTFHETVMEASQNPFFLETLKRLNRIRRLLAYRSMTDRKRYYTQAEEHLQILDWLERKNQSAAADTMRKHLLHVATNLRDIANRLLPPSF